MIHAALVAVAAVLGATPAPVTLFTDEPAAATADPAALGGASELSTSLWLWILLAAVVLVVSAAISIQAWRGRWRDPPATRAASALSKSLALTADQRRMLDRLAEAIGTEPVALLLSESAFERAIAAVERHPSSLDPKDKATLLALRAAVFGGSAGTISSAEAPQDDPRRAPINLAA